MSGDLIGSKRGSPVYGTNQNIVFTTWVAKRGTETSDACERYVSKLYRDTKTKLSLRFAYVVAFRSISISQLLIYKSADVRGYVASFEIGLLPV
jgi:hypothetical protein